MAGYGKEGCASPHQDPKETERIQSTMATFFKIPELQINRLFTLLQKTHTITNNNGEICIYYCQFVILSYFTKYSIVINIITRHHQSFYCALSEQTVPHRFKVH